MSALSYRIRASRANNSAMVAAILNALNAEAVARVFAVGTMTDEAYNGLVENLGTEGDVFLRFDVSPGTIRTATTYQASKLARKLLVSPVDVHDGADWAIVGHTFRNRPETSDSK